MGCLKVISTFVKKHTSERVHTLYDKEVLRHVRRQCGAEEEEIEGDVVPVHKLLQRALMVLHILALSQALSHSGDASGRFLFVSFLEARELPDLLLREISLENVVMGGR